MGTASPFSAAVDEYSHQILKRLDTLIAPPKMTLANIHSSALDVGGSNNSNNNNNNSSFSTWQSASSFGSTQNQASATDPFFPRGFPSSGFPRANPLRPSTSPSSSSITPATAEDGLSSLRRCPICQGRRREETALSVSGFVFCHDCISQYLKQHGVCPVTKLPAKTTNLVRLYPGF